MSRRRPDSWSSDSGHGWLPDEREDAVPEPAWSPTQVTPQAGQVQPDAWAEVEPDGSTWDDAPVDAVSGAPAPERRARRGLHLGPLRITATRVMLGVALIGSVAFVAYAFTVRESTQIPMLASGAGVLGLVFLALAAAGAVGSYRAGRAGQGGRAVILAFGGGVAMLLSAGCLAGAVIGALVARQGS